MAIGLLASALAVALNALPQPQLTAVASDGTFLISFSPFSREICCRNVRLRTPLYHRREIQSWTPSSGLGRKNLCFFPFQTDMTSPLGLYTLKRPLRPTSVSKSSVQSRHGVNLLMSYDLALAQPQLSANTHIISCTRRRNTFYDSETRTNSSAEDPRSPRPV